MDQQETHHEKLARVAREMDTVIRGQARRKWEKVRTANRNEKGRHVWRFRSGGDGSERFLHVTHAAMRQGENPAQQLLRQLRAERWLDRLSEGPATALLLSEDGRLEPWPSA
jgi:hypothetical protein